MDEARHILALTERLYALAVDPENSLLTLSELEHLAEQELADKSPGEGSPADDDADS